MAELELGRVYVAKVGIEKAKWVQIGDVVTTNLVRANKQLGLVAFERFTRKRELGNAP